MESTSGKAGDEHNERAVAVCTDLSEQAGVLLQQAKKICLRRGTNLQVLHVFEVGDASEMTAAGMTEYLEAVQERTERLRIAVDNLHVPGLRITPVLLVGNVVQRICEFVDDTSPDLLIMGTAGRRGLERLFLGSTAETILRSASCPVLTIGPNASGYTNGPVVLPTDFNPCASQDFRFALDLAASLRVSLRCVHFLPAKVFAAENAIVRTVLTEALRKLASDAGGKADSVEVYVEPGGHLSRDIVDFAHKSSASAIVLGVMRRAALQSHLPTHETFKVLATATCPVYTVNHSKDEPLLSAVA